MACFISVFVLNGYRSFIFYLQAFKSIVLCRQTDVPCSDLNVKCFWIKVLISKKPNRVTHKKNREKKSLSGNLGWRGHMTGTPPPVTVLGNRWHSGHCWAVTELSHWENWVTGTRPASFALARRQAYQCDSAGRNGIELLLRLTSFREVLAL